MSTTSDGVGGGVVNPPPTPGKTAAVPPMTAEALGAGKFNVVAEERNRAGGVTRIRDLDYMGGKLVVYECVNQKQVGGVPVHEVTASSVTFVPGEIMTTGRKKRSKSN